jgi:hypothetical protein
LIFEIVYFRIQAESDGLNKKILDNIDFSGSIVLTGSGTGRFFAALHPPLQYIRGSMDFTRCTEKRRISEWNGQKKQGGCAERHSP